MKPLVRGHETDLNRDSASLYPTTCADDGHKGAAE